MGQIRDRFCRHGSIPSSSWVFCTPGWDTLTPAFSLLRNNGGVSSNIPGKNASLGLDRGTFKLVFELVGVPAKGNVDCVLCDMKTKRKAPTSDKNRLKVPRMS
jgi:hypothetical protein